MVCIIWTFVIFSLLFLDKCTFTFLFSFKQTVTPLETINETIYVKQNNNKAGADVSELVDNCSNIDGCTILFTRWIILYAQGYNRWLPQDVEIGHKAMSAVFGAFKKNCVVG